MPTDTGQDSTGGGMSWVSVRMRATRNGQHVSGAERLVPAVYAVTVSNVLVERARRHASGEPDRIVLTVDRVPHEAVRFAPILAARTVCVESATEGRRAAMERLRSLGVSEKAISSAMDALTHGANPFGGNMRGAMLIDRAMGERLERDHKRGVRVSFVDLTPEGRARFDVCVRGRGDVSRFRDALVLASKVASLPGVVADLCWSDDPAYVAGYVAARDGGYVRYPRLKERGIPFGGRAYFVDAEAFDLEKDIEYLQSAPVLIEVNDPSVFNEF
ncbi:MAG: 6-carboxyhexanoate--CoA ligase [Candidatus Poribacteria bacterium]|nr:6-carboxyhexanoate--CoA ligase [Candidatus Poribacteria bacterium]